MDTFVKHRRSITADGEEEKVSKNVLSGKDVVEEGCAGEAATEGRQTFTAPGAILNEVAVEDFDPFAEHRGLTIADTEDEYEVNSHKLISSEVVEKVTEGKSY